MRACSRRLLLSERTVNRSRSFTRSLHTFSPVHIGLLPLGEGNPAAAWSDSDKRGCRGQRTCGSPLFVERSSVRRRGVIPLTLAVPGPQSRCSFSLGQRADADI